MRRTRKWTISIIGAGAIAASLTACGNAYPAHSVTDGVRSTTAAASAKADLTKTISFAGGQTTIAPPGDTTPRMTATEVLRGFKSSSAYDANLDSLNPPQVHFGLYTNTGWGPIPSANADFTPFYVKTPAWLIEYQNVRAAPAGPDREADIRTGPEFFIITDKTGEVLLSMIDTPNSNPTPGKISTPPPGK